MALAPLDMLVPVRRSKLITVRYEVLERGSRPDLSHSLAFLRAGNVTRHLGCAP
jgi:hypothetical protein